LILNRLIKIIFLAAILITVLSFNFKPSSSVNGELIVSGNQIFIVEMRTLIQTGNIIVKDNGTLLIENGEMQLSIRGEKGYNVTVMDNGKLLIINGNLTALNEASTILLMGNANLTLLNAFITGFNKIKFFENSSFTAESLKLNVKAASGNCSIVKIKNSKALDSTVNLNCSKAFIENFISKYLSLNSTESSIISFQGENLNALSLKKINLENVLANNALIGSLNASIKDSKFKLLIVKGFGNIYNVTTFEQPLIKAGGIIYALPNSTFLRYWYLTLNIVDLTNTGVPANVTMFDLHGSIVLRGKASITGKFKAVVLAEEINETKTLFVGNYLIQAEYKNYSTFKMPLTMNMNKEASIKFYYIIPIESAVLIQISKGKVRVGDSVAVKGKIELPIENALIEIHYVKPDGSEIVKAVFTNVDGSFTSNFIPDTTRNWIIYANWVGGENYIENKVAFSQKLMLYVEEKPSPAKALLTTAPIAVIVLTITLVLAFFTLQRKKPK
jgi:hypothetical protein